MQSVHLGMTFVEFVQRGYEVMTGDWEPFITFLIRFLALAVIGLCIVLIFTIFSETSPESKKEDVSRFLLVLIIIFLAICVFIFPPIVMLAWLTLFVIPFVQWFWEA